MLWYWLTLVLIVLFGLSPILLWLAAGVVVNIYDCRIGDGGSSCMINGTDYGSMLFELFWFEFTAVWAIPAGFVLFIVWLLILTVHRRVVDHGHGSQ